MDKTIIVLLLLLMLLMNNNKTNESWDMGGLKEWGTDQTVDEEDKKDEDARKAAEKAALEDICIPIGEGENCW